MPSTRASIPFLFSLIAVSGCGGAGLGQSGPEGAGDGGAVAADLQQGPDIAIPYPAPHPAPPQVATAGGAVLLQPRIVPVFFSNDDAAMKSQIKDFVNRVGATHYWKTATQEYDGIGAATATAAVELTEAAPTTIADSAIQTWLAGKLNGNDPLWPKPDANTVYALHYPATTTITNQSFLGTSQSCQDFGGYHNDVTLDANHNGQPVAYAVIPRCGNFGGLNGIDAVTGAESHELIEAATDPHPTADPAYGQIDSDHLYWMFVVGGGEVGDMCAQDPQAFVKFPELPYVVQRIWSNQSAAAGHDPCVPTLSNQPYFNSVPELNDDVTVSLGPMSLTMKGVQIPIGQSKSVTLDLFSDAPTAGPWTVKAQDAAMLLGMTASLQMSLDKSTGQNGDKLHLTIKAAKASQFGASVFLLTSHLGGHSTFWFGLVGN